MLLRLSESDGVLLLMRQMCYLDTQARVWLIIYSCLQVI